MLHLCSPIELGAGALGGAVGRDLAGHERAHLVGGCQGGGAFVAAQPRHECRIDAGPGPDPGGRQARLGEEGVDLREQQGLERITCHASKVWCVDAVRQVQKRRWRFSSRSGHVFHMAQMNPKQARQAARLARQAEVRALIRHLVDVERRSTRIALSEATGHNASYFTKYLRPEGSNPPPEPEALSEADTRTVERLLALPAFSLSIDPPSAATASTADRPSSRLEIEWLRHQLSPTCQVRILVTGEIGRGEMRRLLALLETQIDWLEEQGKTRRSNG